MRDSSTGGSNTAETGEEFVEVTNNMVSSKVPGQGSSIHSGSKSKMKKSELQVVVCKFLPNSTVVLGV